ncbi:unnamed protein product [Durusdinium trenchii]|uniref:Uncharacterized protein n=1 Tax=Durusdinium trenchii TaxID=1381693 RepID=A0ABP0IRS3_9DINO
MVARFVIAVFATLLVVATTSRDDVAMLQQSRKDIEPSGLQTTQADSLEDMALGPLMLKVKEECLSSTQQCLPALIEARHRVWPYVQAELGKEIKPYEPSSFSADFASAWLKDEVCHGKTFFLLHVWKAVGWGGIENLQQLMGGNVERHNLGGDLHPYDCQNVSHPSTFTFVRDPLTRFISGYAQLEQLREQQIDLFAG